MIMQYLDDVRTFITTEHPPREHYLPLPIQISIIAALLVLSALFSGLTLGLMSLTPMELELVQKSGVSFRLPSRTALRLNNSSSSSGFLALFISSAGIVVFGEIIPQSICVKKGLAVGAYTIFITRLFILITFPVAWPISKLLDYLLGDEYVHLALIDPDDNFTVKTVCGYHKHLVKFVDSDAPLRGVLEDFKKGDAHLAMVRQLAPDSGGDPLYELVGIVTLEDIVEEILQAEIVDEFDVVTDNVSRIKRINYQARDISKFFEKETIETQVSMQIQMVAEQWLVANEPAFGENLIARGVLERLIRTCARHVDVSSLMALAGDPVVVPRIAKLFTKGELSD
uniref:CNNM transmembrane domain-containing protein n=1 Tax=Parascaris equorum TaxID=6256 RepID=A0A914S6M2_PAREQ